MTRLARLLAAADVLEQLMAESAGMYSKNEWLPWEALPEVTEFLAALAAFDDVVREADECDKP